MLISAAVATSEVSNFFYFFFKNMSTTYHIFIEESKTIYKKIWPMGTKAWSNTNTHTYKQHKAILSLIGLNLRSCLLPVFNLKFFCFFRLGRLRVQKPFVFLRIFLFWGNRSHHLSYTHFPLVQWCTRLRTYYYFFLDISTRTYWPHWFTRIFCQVHCT